MKVSDWVLKDIEKADRMGGKSKKKMIWCISYRAYIFNWGNYARTPLPCLWNCIHEQVRFPLFSSTEGRACFTVVLAKLTWSWGLAKYYKVTNGLALLAFNTASLYSHFRWTLRQWNVLSSTLWQILNTQLEAHSKNGARPHYRRLGVEHFRTMRYRDSKFHTEWRYLMSIFWISSVYDWMLINFPFFWS